MASQTYLAFDLGAESGRAVLGRFDGTRFELEEVHRFPNGPVRVIDALHWDALGLFSEIKRALNVVGREKAVNLAGVAVDTWGVDVALVGQNNVLLGNPYHYRDPRFEGMLDQTFKRVSREEIFEITGLQFIQFNTLYQFVRMVDENHPALGAAKTMLHMPDMLSWLMTGRPVSEYTIASTSQMLDARTRKWSADLLQRLNIPTTIMPEILDPGTVIGPMQAWLAEETGVGQVPVIASASHDTGSAVASVPAQTDRNDWCYISSGTWSLMGIEIDAPRITPAVLERNFTNEGGVAGTIRFLKNIAGLYLVQQCRAAWALEGQDLGYDEITKMAADAEPFGALLDPDDAAFLAIGQMPERIAGYCRKTRQTPPDGKGALVRCILESLALRYWQVLNWLEELTDREIRTIHIVGGGTQNRLLSQLTADATGRTVVAGPVEATALGNVMMQAIATGQLSSVPAGREAIRASFKLETYTPSGAAGWPDAQKRFQALTTK
ncbi:MAG: rhamnulokinase [Phycisphaerae bacterium]|nr:rhamnulokinase [Phycisphaerae bacterium]